MLDKALERDPYLAPAMYKLSEAYRLSNERKKADDLLARWQEIKPDRDRAVARPGQHRGIQVYGDMGRYATIARPVPSEWGPPGRRPAPPDFAAAKPLQVKLTTGERWVKPSDFTGPIAVIGRIRARFGAAVAAFDADGDGRLDLYLSSADRRDEGDSRRLALEQGRGPLRGWPRRRSGCPTTAPAWASRRPTSTPTATSTCS